MDKTTRKFLAMEKVNFVDDDNSRHKLTILSDGTWNFTHHEWEYCCFSEITSEKVYVREYKIEFRR